MENTTLNIPLFPLGIFLFNGEKRVLHIFEQRYRNLFEDIQKEDNLLGIPYVRFGQALSSGVLVKHERVIKTYTNGEFDVIIKGAGYINIVNYNNQHPERLYPYGDVQILDPVNFKPDKHVIGEFEKYCKDVLQIEPDKYPIRSLIGYSTIIGLIDWEKYDLISGADESTLNIRLINLMKMKTYLYNQHGIIFENYSLN